MLRYVHVQAGSVPIKRGPFLSGLRFDSVQFLFILFLLPFSLAWVQTGVFNLGNVLQMPCGDLRGILIFGFYIAFCTFFGYIITL